jgi:monoamine oxidase
MLSLRRNSSAHTPLAAALRRAFRIALASTRRNAPPLDEMIDMARVAAPHNPSRRRFVQGALIGGAALAAGGLLEACAKSDNPTTPTKTQPRIAIVGGGIAGLNCAWKLKLAGLTATVYDANTRAGGRMYTATGLMGTGLTTELGGEFIDSDHTDILSLCTEFSLPLYDTHQASESALTEHSYVFGNSVRTEADV